MLIDFEAIQETVVPQMRGGEKSVAMRTHADSLCKIIRGKLIPGASIGFHTHETDSEVLYILSGHGKILYDDTWTTTILRQAPFRHSVTTSPVISSMLISMVTVVSTLMTALLSLTVQHLS